PHKSLLVRAGFTVGCPLLRHGRTPSERSTPGNLGLIAMVHVRLLGPKRIPGGDKLVDSWLPVVLHSFHYVFTDTWKRVSPSPLPVTRLAVASMAKVPFGDVGRRDSGYSLQSLATWRAEECPSRAGRGAPGAAFCNIRCP